MTLKHGGQIEPRLPTTSREIIHRDRHGDKRKAFMCKHLMSDSGLGFISDKSGPDNPHPDAWCSECERVRIEGGGEFSDNYARSVIKLVCGDCYNEIKAKHVTD